MIENKVAKMGEVWSVDYWHWQPTSSGRFCDQERRIRVTGQVVWLYPGHIDLDVGPVDFKHFPGEGIARVERHGFINWKKLTPLEALAWAGQNTRSG